MPFNIGSGTHGARGRWASTSDVARRSRGDGALRRRKWPARREEMVARTLGSEGMVGTRTRLFLTARARYRATESSPAPRT